MKMNLKVLGSVCLGALLSAAAGATTYFLGSSDGYDDGLKDGETMGVLADRLYVTSKLQQRGINPDEFFSDSEKEEP